MILAFGEEVLSPEAPVVLPAPLTAGTMFLPSGLRRDAETALWLTDHGTEADDRRSLWLVLIWDRTSNERAIACAAYARTPDGIVKRGIEIKSDYAMLPLERFMDAVGHRLCTTIPVTIGPDNVLMPAA